MPRKCLWDPLKNANFNSRETRNCLKPRQNCSLCTTAGKFYLISSSKTTLKSKNTEKTQARTRKNTVKTQARNKNTQKSVFHSRISIKNGPANKKHYKNAGAKKNTKKIGVSFEDFSQNRQVARLRRLDFSLPARNGPGPPAKTSKRTIRNHSPPRRQAGR